MQDSTFEPPMDTASDRWTPQLVELETLSPDHAGAGTLELDNEDLIEMEEMPAVEADPGQPYGLTMEAGPLEKGRRRDLDSGALLPETLKIVYWGPGRSGKTTNVRWLHHHLRPEMKGRLIDLDTPGERTLYFDCLPLDLERGGHAPLPLRVYTVPGQPRFRLTRKLVLDAVDGIVFVWDARARRLNANLASLIEMRETLTELGMEWHRIPRIIQYNKCDLPDVIPAEQLDHVIKRMGEPGPRFLSVATRGTGVLDTLGAITREVVKRHLAHRERMAPLAGW